MNEEEQNRKFQLQMLEVSLRHEREVAITTAWIAIGASIIVLGVTMLYTISLLEQTLTTTLGQQWINSGYLYGSIGTVIMVVSTLIMLRLRSSEKKDIDSIRQQFIEKPKTKE